MNVNEMFPSTYLKAADLPPMKQIKVTIVNVEMHTFKDNDTGQTSEKPIIYFAGKDKGMTLNWGNAQLLFSQVAPDSDDWIGKEICIYNDPNVMMGKKRVGGLRISILQHQGTTIDNNHDAPALTNGNGHTRAAPIHHETVYDQSPIDDEVPF